MRHELKLVTFDLDGTLYELPKTRLRMLLSCFPRWRALRVGRAVREELRGRVFDNGAALLDAEAALVAERLGANGASTRGLLDDLFNRRLIDVLRRVGARPGTHDVLRSLVDRGLKIAVISDRGSVKEKLGALGLGDLPWSALVSADDEGVLKPGLALFQRCAGRCGVDVREILHVGDREDSDGDGARAAGCAFVLVDKEGPLPPLP